MSSRWGSRCIEIAFDDADIRGVIAAHIIFRDDGVITHVNKNSKAWSECLAPATTPYSTDGQWRLLSRHVQMPPGAIAYNPSPSAWSAWEPAEGKGAYRTQAECLKAAESGQSEMSQHFPRFLFEFRCVRGGS